jgi:hypothetical protein
MAAEGQGPAAYFPSIEKRYGRPVGEWLDLVHARVDAGAPATHGRLVTWLKTEHGMGHGHATAVVAHALRQRS